MAVVMNIKNGKDLLPCPFCGGEATLKNKLEFFGHGDCYKEYYVMCDSCKSKGGIETVYNLTEDERKKMAVRNWNTRTQKERGD